MFEHGRRDEDLFHTANCLVKGGMPGEEITQVLERLIISWGEEVDSKWVNTKVKSALKRADRRERNIAEEVRCWVEVSEGIWKVSECLKESQIVSRDERHAATLELKRLVNQGIIERHGEIRGTYRTVSKDCDSIDFLHAPDQTVDLRWPFGIERYFTTLPKNIVVVAGESDSGKTAFLLNLTRFNMTHHRIHYFSSEMGPIEMRDRLSKFDFPLDKWNFDAKERANNYADVVHPDEINVIDFLEIHDEFYKVGGMIKEIFDKLKNGVAIIALQKNRGTDFGLGGARSLEKARLYLAIEPGKIKIIKAKNWATKMNPNGLCLKFKLIQGCDFRAVGDWQQEQEDKKK